MSSIANIKNTGLRRTTLLLWGPITLTVVSLVAIVVILAEAARAGWKEVRYQVPHNAKTIFTALRYNWMGDEAWNTEQKKLHENRVRRLFRD